MQDLNSLISPGSGWTLAQAKAINNLGDIVGYGTSPQGNTEAFLLTPTPEPTPAALLAFAGAGMLLLGKRRSRN